MNATNLDILISARRIANYAVNEGVLEDNLITRSTCEHMGAVLADSILQAGLNYSTVVRPRVFNILKYYPHTNTVSSLLKIIDSKQTATYLQWEHHQKITRFENLVTFLRDIAIEDVSDLRDHLVLEKFSSQLQEINGIGPKTVDYLACLIGVESIAVDRHVRSFAKRVGVINSDYYFLRNVFCYAADLIDISRRDFDAWVWHKESFAKVTQCTFDF